VTSSEVAEAIHQAGLKSLSPEALTQFESYLALLMKWNARLNLTAIRDEKTILNRHFVECIQCAQALPNLSKGSTLLDFGSGAGLPGIPIAICRPDIRVTLAESQKKKAAFLREAARTLHLDMAVFDGRVEEMPPEQQFQVVTLRAVDKMAEACRVATERLPAQAWIMLFATTGTEAPIRAALPEIVWQKKIPLFDLHQGSILLGQRKE
jgi:16S rRNA (guanine527-N7)-methyltransferase